ncbi:hypothetical protein [Kitasatospora cheerisanensis]|uniref:Uncharacterized protein n=1 Tax=Kitasatospora cheerisanensis KCTC 2395 TaxID=1348663 RepID=A0A066YV80_9ACTN|nr:hypothetical protein [Kitasatospora cheerisanensis]KDN82001.1 hypothetical protein KCH_61550 [Kitasatospora cheerisanensis KCTC 2395]
MVVYDTALLYNSAHLRTRWPELAGWVAVLAVTGRWRPADPAAVGPGTAALATVLRRGLVLFLVPALAVRYGLGFADPRVALAGGLLTAACALADRQVRAALLPLSLAVTAGLVAGYVALRAVTDTYVESGLLRAMAALLGTATVVCAVADRRRRNGPSSPSPHRQVQPGARSLSSSKSPR